MTKCCVYMVNQHPLYMTFAYNWIKAYQTLTNGQELPLLPKAFF